MRACRAFYALGLTAFAFAPLIEPFREMALVMLLEPKRFNSVAEDGKRFWHLALNTLDLTGGTVAAAMPIGVAGSRCCCFAPPFSAGVFCCAGWRFCFSSRYRCWFRAGKDSSGRTDFYRRASGITPRAGRGYRASGRRSGFTAWRPFRGSCSSLAWV